MRESAAQLRLIADAMPALISYIAPDGTYRFTNKLYQSWFGKAPEEVVGRHMRDVLGREAFEVVRPRLERAMQGTRVFFEQSIPYASGPREVAVHYIPDVGIDGTVRGCFALIEDVSARKRAERVAARGGPAQGRFSRHSRARVAQSIGADPKCRAHPESQFRRCRNRAALG